MPHAKKKENQINTTVCFIFHSYVALWLQKKLQYSQQLYVHCIRCAYVNVYILFITLVHIFSYNTWRRHTYAPGQQKLVKKKIQIYRIEGNQFGHHQLQQVNRKSSTISA